MIYRVWQHICKGNNDVLGRVQDDTLGFYGRLLPCGLGCPLPQPPPCPARPRGAMAARGALAASMHSPLNHSTPPAQSLREAIANIRNPLTIATLSAMNPRSFKAHVNRAIEHSGNQHLRPAINSILSISPSRGVRYVDSSLSVGPWS